MVCKRVSLICFTYHFGVTVHSFSVDDSSLGFFIAKKYSTVCQFTFSVSIRLMMDM